MTSDFSLPESSCGFGFMAPFKFKSRFELDDESVGFVITHQNVMAMMDSMSCCKFVIFGLGENYMSCYLEWIKQVMGWDSAKILVP